MKTFQFHFILNSTAFNTATFSLATCTSLSLEITWRCLYQITHLPSLCLTHKTCVQTINTNSVYNCDNIYITKIDFISTTQTCVHFSLSTRLILNPDLSRLRGTAKDLGAGLAVNKVPLIKRTMN